jgi:hypothetical protein
MPHMDPLKASAKQDRVKQTRAKAAPARRLKLTTRDPRAKRSR